MLPLQFCRGDYYIILCLLTCQGYDLGIIVGQFLIVGNDAIGVRRIIKVSKNSKLPQVVQNGQQRMSTLFQIL